MPDISVIIPARNAAATIRATLRGIERQQFRGDYDVTVVDDGSADETPVLAEQSGVVTRVLRLNGAGAAAARNLGAASTAGALLAFIDADCEPTDQWLASGFQALREADLVLGQTKPDPAQTLGPFDHTLWVNGVSPLFESANLFVRRELFDALQGFENWTGVVNGRPFGEDAWFGWRARRAGWRIASCAEALVYHAVFPRGMRPFVAERWRYRLFPPMVRRIPELRRDFCHRRIFHSRRSAAFDLALAGFAGAFAFRRMLPLVGAIPYARILWWDATGGQNPGGIRLVAGRLGADAVGAAALAYGSVRSRSLLL